MNPRFRLLHFLLPLGIVVIAFAAPIIAMATSEPDLWRLIPSGATAAHSRKILDIVAISFSVQGKSISQARNELREHFRSVGWYICPALDMRRPHDGITVNAIGEKHPPRKPDGSFDASLGRDWDVGVLFYRTAPYSTYVDMWLTKSFMGPLCAPGKDYP